MSLAVQPDEEMAQGLVRVGCGLFASALGHLGRAAEVPIVAVHEARRNIRSLRAMLRLLRPVIGEHAYLRERALLREAANRLSPHRDNDVQMAAFDRLAAHLDGDERLGWVRRVLRAHLARSAGPLEANAGAAADLLREAETVLASARPAPEDAGGAVREAIRQSVKRVRKSHAMARKGRAPEHLHELRKRCKDLRDQLRVLMPLEPDRLATLERRFDRVCDLLGQARDLQLLRGSLDAVASELPEGTDAIEAVRRLAAEQEADLVERAMKRSRRAAAHRPREVSELIGAG